eukprot:1369987-Alexandrium_andersonii.AAC.1
MRRRSGRSRRRLASGARPSACARRVSTRTPTPIPRTGAVPLAARTSSTSGRRSPFSSRRPPPAPPPWRRRAMGGP